jgi:surface antigen
MYREFLKGAAVAAVAFSLAACASTPPSAPASIADVILGADRATPTDDTPRMVTPDRPTQCVPYARERSGIALYGNAYTWWEQARGRYEQDDEPTEGSVIILAGYNGPKSGHVAVVARVVSSREIRVDHANWMNDGKLYLNTPVIDVSPDNDWTQVRVWNTRDGHLGTTTYSVRGFIAPSRVAGS